jgi:repressor of nif and glnA expression
VTAEVVRAVLAKFGTATAAEIAQEITKAGAPVSGRAVRFLAERAGAHTFIGEDGQRRYRI